MLNAKLGSPRLRKLDKLLYNGFEDLELKKLERTLFTVLKMVDDIEREYKELKVWNIQHRHLKDFLCEVDDILDDIALRAPQLVHLLQSPQVSHHPYLTDKLVNINSLIQELDTLAAEIKYLVLPEFNTRRRKPPGTIIHSAQSKPVSSHAPTADLWKDPTPVPNEMSMFFAFVTTQPTTTPRLKNEPVQNDDENISKSYDTSKTIEDTGRRKNYTESMVNPDDFVINDEEPLPTSGDGASMSKTITSINSLPEHLKRCLVYTSLFPRNYEFKKDMLVQLWIAVDFIRHEDKLMEDSAGEYFEELFSMSRFQASSLDPSRYILQDDVYKLLQGCAPGGYAKLEDGNLNGISKETLHTSVLCKSTFDPSIFKSFHKLKGLHSLLLLHDIRKYIKLVPYDLFLSLRCLRVLDVSGTLIRELPSSVGNMEALCYLDLSGTPIKRLPQSISSLYSLQYWKLRDCLNFVELPRDMKFFVNLRHLELDIIRQLSFMPSKMGKLTTLQSLSAFIGGKERGTRISELKGMTNLRGSLHIVKLENALSVEDAEEAALYDKPYLHKLELQWSHPCLEAVDVLEGLEPHRNLRELDIVCYGGLTFPTWFGDSSFSNLATISIYHCKNCVLLPLLGRLPSLRSLRVGEMDTLKKVDARFCG